MSSTAAQSRATAMTLAGAWSLSGRPIEQFLPQANRRAALAFFPSGANPRETTSGRLWLAADEHRLMTKPGRFLAWDGWLCASRDQTWELEPRLLGKAPPPAQGPAGHYVAVHADTERGRLSLLRDPTGGERLYFILTDKALFFSASARAALALAGVAPTLDAETALERGMTEMVHFGDRTLWAGLREVLPGHRAALSEAGISQEWAWAGLLDPVKGELPETARSLRANLKQDIAQCVGGDGRAAVALSGGLDSSAVAALAAELVGPQNVDAFTIEYQHPSHPSEAPYASEVCRALGMKPPQVVRITAEDVMASVPEGVWLTEDPRYWKRTYPMLLAKAAAQAGFDRFLTGFGIGSHMGYLEEFARVAARLPLPAVSLRPWAASARPFPGGRTLLSSLHPGFDAPMKRLLYPILAVLRSRGMIADARPFFPAELRPLISRLFGSPRVAQALARSASMPLGRQLQIATYEAMNSCVDVARCERVARRVGAHWLGPAHFPASLPYCYLPTRPLRPLWDSRRRARPGKFLLSQAMRGTLPQRIIDRPKYWPHANGPTQWRDLSLERMSAAAGPSWDALRGLFGHAFDAARRYCPEGMIPLAFWHRVCLDGRRSAAPTWEDLGC